MDEEQIKRTLEYAKVFSLLLESERFKYWFEANYTLVRNEDPDSPESEIALIEKPTEEVDKEALQKLKDAVRGQMDKKKVELVGPDVMAQVTKRRAKN
jgi:hypothetical protein